MEDFLKIDCQEEEQKIVAFVQKSMEELHKDGVVIGLSGGLDSSVCAYLLVKSLGKEKVLALLLPEKDSYPIHYKHAQLVGKILGIETIKHDLTGILNKIGVYKIGPDKKRKKADIEYFKNDNAILEMLGDRMASAWGGEKSLDWNLLEESIKKILYKSNSFIVTKNRLRMLYFSFYALKNNYAVIGTNNKTEYKIGLYDKNGDIAPLEHLYKTQLKQLAKHLELPTEIINKPESGDNYINLSRDRQLGMSTEQLDTLLVAIEKGYDRRQLAEIVLEKKVEDIKKCIDIANLMRKFPLSLY